jgi:hypothetical protein
MAVACAAAGVALGLTLLLHAPALPWLRECLFAVLFTIVYLALARALVPRRLAEAVTFVRSVIRR